jgi:hypothetical protein
MKIRKPPKSFLSSALIGKDVASGVVESGLKTYDAWRAGRESACTAGSVPTVKPVTAARYKSADTAPNELPQVDVIELPGNPGPL